MNRITPFFVIGSIGLGVDGSCIAPMMPGPTMCGECEDVRGGSQCVSSGRWFSCYSSIAACCDSWDIKNQVSSATCVKASEEAAANAGSDVDPNEEIPQTDNDYCTKVVSLSEAQTNGDCMDQCDTLMKKGMKPEDDKDWSSKCVYSHWYPHNGRTVVDGDCFEKWIYGYSQEVNLASIDDKLIVDTPAQCQLHCQLNDDCVNWAWVSELYASTGSEKVGRCLLKNKKMVEMALTIKTSSHPSPNGNTQYCNYGMSHECSTNHYRCLPCGGGDLRCVWESDMHITGWKYCTPTDTCAPFNPLTTPIPPSTTPATTTTVATTTTTTTTTTTPTTTTTTEATTPEPTTPEPTSEPVEPTDELAEPTPEPVEPTDEPAQPTDEPEEPTDEPEEPTPEPAEPTPEPEETYPPVQPPNPGSTSTTTPAAPTTTAEPEEPTTYPEVEPSRLGDTTTETPSSPPVEPTDAQPEVTTSPPVQPPSPKSTTSDPATLEPVGSGDIVTRPPHVTPPTEAPSVWPSEEPTGPAVDGSTSHTTTGVAIATATIRTTTIPAKDTTTGVLLDNTTSTPEEGNECHPKESTEGGIEECVPPKKPSCNDKCECRGRPHCSCCEKGQLYIRVSDRPKRLHFDLEN